MLASASEVVGLTIGMFGLLFRECLLCQPQAEVQEATKLTTSMSKIFSGFEQQHLCSVECQIENETKLK